MVLIIQRIHSFGLFRYVLTIIMITLDTVKLVGRGKVTVLKYRHTCILRLFVIFSLVRLTKGLLESFSVSQNMLLLL